MINGLWHAGDAFGHGATPCWALASSTAESGQTKTLAVAVRGLRNHHPLRLLVEIAAQGIGRGRNNGSQRPRMLCCFELEHDAPREMVSEVRARRGPIGSPVRASLASRSRPGCACLCHHLPALSDMSLSTSRTALMSSSQKAWRNCHIRTLLPSCY